MYLGCHLSASAGYAAMVETAVSIGADTFAFFTRNPRGSRAKRENPEDAARARELLEAGHFATEAPGIFALADALQIWPDAVQYGVCVSKSEAPAYA